jgi:3-hydroxymyristoyl/3-hydroxydecanoyl-(acyl carrier protein) dehydratase
MPSAEPFEVLASEADGVGWRLLLRVPEGTPLCDGHFPGHPIVPGVAHLAWVERALGELQEGREVAVAVVRGFRLRRPVHPGDELELTLQPAAEGEGGFVFAIRRGGEAVSDGRVEKGGRAAPAGGADGG